MVSKIPVPTDGSKTAQKAAMYAVDLAKQLKAGVIALSVIDKRPFMGQTVPAGETARHIIEPVEDYLREAAEGYAGEIKKLCDKDGVQSKTVVTAGHPVEVIVKEAQRAKANLIIMGSHGKSALAAAVLGSVTYGVIHKDTKIPVLLLEGDEGEPPGLGWSGIPGQRNLDREMPGGPYPNILFLSFDNHYLDIHYICSCGPGDQELPGFLEKVIRIIVIKIFIRPDAKRVCLFERQPVNNCPCCISRTVCAVRSC